MQGSGSCRDLSIIPCSGPFLPDVPGFQVPSDSVFPSQLQSSYRALPLHLHFPDCSDVFCFVFLLTCPNHSNLRLLITVDIYSTFASSKISFLLCSNRLTPIAHRTILISVVAKRFSSLTDIAQHIMVSIYCRVMLALPQIEQIPFTLVTLNPVIR